MRKSETEWRPNQWIALILGFLLQPLGMLYVIRVKLAVIYFVLGIIIIVTEFVLRSNTGNEWLDYFSFTWLLMIACSIHAYRLAKHWQPVAARPWYSRWYGLGAIPLTLFLLIFSVRAFLYEPFRIPAGSMLPFIEVGSILLTQKWGYGNYGTYGVSLVKTELTNAVHRGDVIVFEFPKNPSIYYTKRIVGLPGDTVKYQGKKLFINKITVEIAQVSSDKNFDIFQETLNNAVYKIINSRAAPAHDFEFTIPDRSYFVLGDNRDHSNDSRYWGFVPEKNIVGKVIHVFK